MANAISTRVMLYSTGIPPSSRAMGSASHGNIHNLRAAGHKRGEAAIGGTKEQQEGEGLNGARKPKVRTARDLIFANQAAGVKSPHQRDGRPSQT